MDATLIQPWKDSVPPFFADQAEVPPRYALAQAVMTWRYRNLRIIMYRPFVIRRALRRRAESDPPTEEAYGRCLADAKATVETISDYWNRHEHNRLSAWYGLYVVLQRQRSNWNRPKLLILTHDAGTFSFRPP
jgi:transcriptional regulatory protein GAL4